MQVVKISGALVPACGCKTRRRIDLIECLAESALLLVHASRLDFTLKLQPLAWQMHNYSLFLLFRLYKSALAGCKASLERTCWFAGSEMGDKS